MMEFLSRPWPWYVSGPLLGLMVPILLLVTNRQLGISASLRHVCALVPWNRRIGYFNYDLKSQGLWNLLFAVGLVMGGFLGGYVFQNPEPVAISARTQSDLRSMGIANFQGMMPVDIFNWTTAFSAGGILMLVGGGLLIGFGTRYAGGCTSGHSIMGVANLRISSFVASAAFFAGGIAMTHLALPWVLRL